MVTWATSPGSVKLMTFLRSELGSHVSAVGRLRPRGQGGELRPPAWEPAATWVAWTLGMWQDQIEMCGCIKSPSTHTRLWRFRRRKVNLSEIFLYGLHVDIMYQVIKNRAPQLFSSLLTFKYGYLNILNDACGSHHTSVGRRWQSSSDLPEPTGHACHLAAFELTPESDAVARSLSLKTLARWAFAGLGSRFCAHLNNCFFSTSLMGSFSTQLLNVGVPRSLLHPPHTLSLAEPINSSGFKFQNYMMTPRFISAIWHLWAPGLRIQMPIGASETAY